MRNFLMKLFILAIVCVPAVHGFGSENLVTKRMLKSLGVNKTESTIISQNKSDIGITFDWVSYNSRLGKEKFSIQFPLTYETEFETETYSVEMVAFGENNKSHILSAISRSFPEIKGFKPDMIFELILNSITQGEDDEDFEDEDFDDEDKAELISYHIFKEKDLDYLDFELRIETGNLFTDEKMQLTVKVRIIVSKFNVYSLVTNYPSEDPINHDYFISTFKILK